MHPPTPPARRLAALQFQADPLTRDAEAWGFRAVIRLTEGRPLCKGPDACPHRDAPAMPEPCRACGSRNPLPF